MGSDLNCLCLKWQNDKSENSSSTSSNIPSFRLKKVTVLIFSGMSCARRSEIRHNLHSAEKEEDGLEDLAREALKGSTEI